ncbi:MAG: TetR/AcrR family transcriptional regulator [Clostridia bacterium]|jgi:regulatory protein
MPKDTFLNLSEDKKNKIINAAKKEFARVPIEEASIKNIVEEAEIARGSFYQYFESKEDLLKYILNSKAKNLEAFLKQSLQETKR